MEQRETEQRNGTNGIEMERILVWHGYHSPVSVGEGSFSQVYRVTDSSGGFRACRVSDVTEQWQRECENWQEIRHPLFPGYVEHWTEGGKGYLIMEFWDGMDLRKMLERRGRLTPGHAAWIADQIAEGIQYLHERQHPFLYRDLKPENIRIRVDGRAGILDLGCLWNREQDWSGAGNRSFSAPEQFVPGEIPGEESDVYAVGRLLAVMLGDDTDGTVRQSGGIRRRNAEKRCGRKEQRQEKWLRKVIAMATCEERKDRIPEIKMLRTLLMVTDDSGRERKRACRAADFYYVRKLYCP